jgi:hypothetical protein
MLFMAMCKAMMTFSRPNIWLQRFSAANESLNKATFLAHPAQAATLALEVDASNTHMGGCLQHRRLGWEPLGFFSKKLEKAQSNYLAFDRELMAIVARIRHFPFMLEGKAFTVFTDHKPTFTLKRSSNPWKAEQCCHLSYIA